MRITIVRHGRSVANDLKMMQFGEFVDTPLTEQGLNQAKQVSERLRDENFDAIYCSPLKRAKQTCEAINEFHKKDIIFDERLVEKKEGELKEVFIERVFSFYNELFDKKDKNVLIVAHGGVNLTLLAFSTGSKESGGKLVNRHGPTIYNTSVSIIEKEGEHFKIKVINNIGHFKDDSLTLRQKFRLVQSIPYKISKFDEREINSEIDFGDCRHKHFLLKRLLEEECLKVKKVKVLFDWKDLPIPKEILGILKSGTKMIHDSLAVKIVEEFLYVDVSWNFELEELGFPVTPKNWQGDCDSEQVTSGELKFFLEGDEDYKKEEYNKNKKELDEFAEKFNFWIEENMRIGEGFFRH